MPHRRLARPQTPPRTRAAAARGPGPPPARACPHPPAGPAPGAAPVVACVARTPTTTTTPPTSAPGAATRAFAPRGLDQLPARGRRLPRQGRRHARQVRPLTLRPRGASGTDGTSPPPRPGEGRIVTAPA